MNEDVHKYHDALLEKDREICIMLASEIIHYLPGAEYKIWHKHPVWFLEGNPIVGYTKLKDCVQLLFWSGQSFEEDDLKNVGGFKAAEARFVSVQEIITKDLVRWLHKAKAIQWDYKNIMKRKGLLKKIG